MTKVAIITGGASGMGHAVAQALSKRSDWEVHILDMNAEAGTKASIEMPNTVFHQTNVAEYSSLSAAVKSAFQSKGQLDFVFANAGVIERKNFYGTHEVGIEAPPELDQTSIDVDLKGLTTMAYLALHYFRRSPHKGKDTSLILNSSCGGLYASYYSPLYTAAKFGALGFMRAIAGHFRLEGIRVNAICPGIVRTNLLDKQGWSGFPQDMFTPVENISDAVCRLIDGGDITDANGRTVPAAKLYGQAVEINLSNIYFRRQHEFSDKAMESIMMATSVENQIGAVLTS
ncbi:uncharacterized protein HMPREF1541_03698 [Cyphellophora europaea CBS 101466]|uniref:Uncharacterized protein n=1 Tax=Cyphellophora europaea (strain CBS 101466) TaxID=1220924 RepID=W2RZ33_CYPE1|nr:uncharacterized protein HMPREF1541_03698 [Cyphellophora europaea CBS 101466]ETN41761.1 hypothetical protein HMPREF1541_03698 [Cyphellophora europaea CBS 101466]